MDLLQRLAEQSGGTLKKDVPSANSFHFIVVLESSSHQKDEAMTRRTDSLGVRLPV